MRKTSPRFGGQCTNAQRTERPRSSAGRPPAVELSARSAHELAGTPVADGEPSPLNVCPENSSPESIWDCHECTSPNRRETPRWSPTSFTTPNSCFSRNMQMGHVVSPLESSQHLGKDVTETGSFGKEARSASKPAHSPGPAGALLHSLRGVRVPSAPLLPCDLGGALPFLSLGLNLYNRIMPSASQACWTDQYKQEMSDALGIRNSINC